MKILFNITLLIVLFLLPNTGIKAEKKINTLEKAEKENTYYIKKFLKPGKITTIKAGLLQKILVGGWRSVPPDGVIFEKDGTFQVKDCSIANGSIVYQGKWEARDTAIAFKVDGAKEWQLCKIIYLKYRTCMPKCPKGVAFRYSLEIILEKTIFNAEDITNATFLDGGFYTSFN